MFQNGSAECSTVPSSTRKVLSCGEKVVKIGPVYPEIFDEIRRTTTSTRNVILISQFYWTDLHQIFTQYSGISGANKSCPYTALSHTVSECQSDENGEFAIFA